MVNQDESVSPEEDHDLQQARQGFHLLRKLPGNCTGVVIIQSKILWCWGRGGGSLWFLGQRKCAKIYIIFVILGRGIPGADRGWLPRGPQSDHGGRAGGCARPRDQRRGEHRNQG